MRTLLTLIRDGIPLFLAVFLIVSASISAARAASQDPSNFRGWKVSGFDVKGLPGGLGGELKKGLLLSGTRKLIFKHYPIFSTNAFAQDIERTRLFLARNGFPAATITPEFKPDSEDRKVKVTFRIEHGPEVEVLENRTTTFPPDLERKAKKVLELEEGERFSDQKVEVRVARLLTILKEAGYAYARVSTRLVESDPTHVIVEFVVDAGEIYTFGTTTVEGVRSDLVEVAQRYIAIAPGDRYSPKPLQQANDNLRLLDLFRQIRIDPKPVPEKRLDILANLDERKMQSLNTSLGYYTEDQIRASATYKHRNLLGGGRGISLNTDYSRFLQEVSFSYWKPTLFHSRTRLSLTTRGRREAEPSYTLGSGEVELAATYLPSTITTFRPSVTFSAFDLRKKSEADTVTAPSPNLIQTSVTWIRADMDDRLNPTRGYQASVHLENGWVGFKARRNYFLAEPEIGAFYPIVSPFVLASRLRLGLSGPYDNSISLLPNKRFYAGGAGSMRGTKRKRLGPLDAENRPIGGTVKMEGTLEIRFPFVWRFAGAVFGDMGQVWQHRNEVRLKDLRFAAGPGLILRTPVGPVRGDVGFLLGHRAKDEPQAVVHISIGTAF